MALPIVAIVGRPNVGKSTLINRICQSEDAIVHEMRGVTRDRSYHEADWNGSHFMMIDTGGIALSDADRFQESITAQALGACEEADVIIFLVDGRTGMTDEDQAIAKVLKRTKTPVMLAVNKIDNPGDESPIWEFYSMGLGDPYPISAGHGHGTGDMLDDLVDKLPANFEEPEDDDSINVAIIGRPNAGKSSLTNRLVGKERSIVADHAGTTRDAIDTVVEHEGTRYRIVDTAGIRKKSSIDEDVEYYGFVRSLRAIDRADVCLLMIDATLGLTDQDQRVAGLAKERGCAMIIVVNKWDLVEDPGRRDEIKDFIEDRLSFVSYAPVLTVSALTGRSCHRIWTAIDDVYEGYSAQIATNTLNHFLTELRDFGHTVVKGTKRLKLNYVTQTDNQPPTFTFFCNMPELVDDSFRRYLENRMRSTFPLGGTPIRMHFKRKN